MEAFAEDPLLELARLAAGLVKTIALLPRPAQVTPSALLTMDEAALHLAVSRTTVQELVDDGRLPVVEVTGRAVRVDPRDLEEFKRRRRVRRG